MLNSIEQFALNLTCLRATNSARTSCELADLAWTEPAHPHQLRDPASIFAIRL
jgi:hypothetical protein